MTQTVLGNHLGGALDKMEVGWARSGKDHDEFSKKMTARISL